ncbi:MAG: hypothetical protein ACTSXK_00715 [Promethearchaeota archaeon]
MQIFPKKLIRNPIKIVLVFLTFTVIANSLFIPYSFLKNTSCSITKHSCIIPEKKYFNTPKASTYSPNVKSPVAVGDELIYSISQNISGYFWNGQEKWKITKIANELGVVNIYASLYRRDSIAESWGNELFTNEIIGALNLNHVTLRGNISIQQKFFSFEFKGFDDSTNAKTIQEEYVQDKFGVNITNSNLYWDDYFEPVLNLTVSNTTHVGLTSFKYSDGILSDKFIDIHNITNDPLNHSYYLNYQLDYSNSVLNAADYHHWGKSTENIPVQATDLITQSDYLIYSVKDGSVINPPSHDFKYTIDSIDPDLENRQTVITTTLERYNDETKIWDLNGSELLFIDHSAPFQLKKYQSNFLILPKTQTFSTDETIEEFSASKYWIESYGIWDSFNFTLNSHSYSFDLKSGTHEIQVSASYGFDMILMNYELHESDNGNTVHYIKYSLDYVNSRILDWLNTPPSAPNLVLDSQTSTINKSIYLHWNQPFYSESYKIYMYVRTGTNSSLSTPVATSFYPFLDGLTQTSFSFEGIANKTYYFRVSSVNPGGKESVLSNAVVSYILPEETKTHRSSLGFVLITIFAVIGLGISGFMIYRVKKKKKSEEFNVADFSK